MNNRDTILSQVNTVRKERKGEQIKLLTFKSSDQFSTFYKVLSEHHNLPQPDVNPIDTPTSLQPTLINPRRSLLLFYPSTPS